MNAVEIAGWAAIIGTSVVVAYAVWGICGKLLWWGAWKWGDAQELIQSARLGWNTGEPPEGEWILVRIHCDEGLVGSPPNVDSSLRWAAMRVHKGWVHSASGGFSMPTKNVTGWIRIYRGEA